MSIVICSHLFGARVIGQMFSAARFTSLVICSCFAFASFIVIYFYFFLIGIEFE